MQGIIVAHVAAEPKDSLNDDGPRDLVKSVQEVLIYPSGSHLLEYAVRKCRSDEVHRIVFARESKVGHEIREDIALCVL